MRQLGFFCPPPSYVTVSVLYLLFTRPSSAAHHVVKNINEVSINSIFAPYGFAEAVAPLNQSAVPSGHCGFCPWPVCPPPLLSLTAAACRPSLRIVSQNILRVPLGTRLHENYSSSLGASGTPDESERLVQPLLASSLCSLKRENKEAPRGRGEGSWGDEFGCEQQYVAYSFRAICFHCSSLTQQRLTLPLSLRWHGAQPWRLPPCPD